MKDCACCQCLDHPPGYQPEYCQCEACNRYGTIDDFPSSGFGLCWDCRDKQFETEVQRTEVRIERKLMLVRGGK